MEKIHVITYESLGRGIKVKLYTLVLGTGPCAVPDTLGSSQEPCGGTCQHQVDTQITEWVSGAC